MDILKQRLEDTSQENDYYATLNRAGAALGRGMATNSTSYGAGVEAWGESLGRSHAHSSGHEDKERLIEELKSEVRRTKDKYESLKHSTHHKKHRHSSSHRHSSRPLVVTDAEGNVVMDPQVLEKTVVELQDKVQRIRRYLPDYM